MFIAKNNDLIILAKDTREELEQALLLVDYTSIEETETNYQLYNGEYLTQSEVDAKETERRGKFKLTKADFWITCLDLGITKAMVKEKIALIPDEIVRAKTEIRLDDAEFFYRGDEGLIALAKMFGITDEQLDAIFKVA